MSLELNLKLRISYYRNCINKSTEAGIDMAFVSLQKSQPN